MPLEPLHEFVGMDDRQVHRGYEIAIRLHLIIQIAGQIGQVVERALQIFGESRQICIHSRNSTVSMGKCRLKLLIDVGGEEPFAEGTRVIQLRGRRGDVAERWASGDGDGVEIRGQTGGVGKDGGQLVG